VHLSAGPRGRRGVGPRPVFAQLACPAALGGQVSDKQPIVRLVRHPPPEEVWVPEYCVQKLYATLKLPKLGCLGIRARNGGAFVLGSMGVWKSLALVKRFQSRRSRTPTSPCGRCLPTPVDTLGRLKVRGKQKQSHREAAQGKLKTKSVTAKPPQVCHCEATPGGKQKAKSVTAKPPCLERSQVSSSASGP
jgi:hypothetical protein